MSYTWAAVLGVLVSIVIDLGLLRTRLVTRRAFWVSYAIIVFFQLIVNGLLTGLDIVRYDPDRIVGLRIVFAPVEDLLFGFAMVLLTLSLWVWAVPVDAQTRRRADR
ncbi:MAG: lycopene cyclase domain-containing protein [Jatrophihabitans sp.]